MAKSSKKAAEEQPITNPGERPMNEHGAYLYSLATDGDMQLSPDFTVREFACHDGSDEVYIHPNLVIAVQAVRDYYAKPVRILSGYRTPSHNVAIGGAQDSQHMRGCAADIQVAGKPAASVYDAIDTGRIHGAVWGGGLGRYNGFTHIDVRDGKARWRG